MRRPPLGKESWKHKNIFETFVLMGPSRTLMGLSRATGIFHGTLSKWARRWDWLERVEGRDQKALMAISSENDKVLKETIMRRHQEAYQSLQEKSLDFILSKGASFMDSKSPMKDAAIALDVGIKGERSVLGLRDTKIKGALVKEGIAAMIEAVMSE